MLENKPELKIPLKPDPDGLLLAEVEARQKDPKKPHRQETAGEVIFDRTVYTGIGFGVNEISAIVIADEFKHGIGKGWFEDISKWMVKNLKFKDTLKNGVTVTAQKNAASMLLWSSLLISGTMLVLPMKELEDNKGYWVKKANHWFDKLRGKKLTAEQVEMRDEEVEQALACQPKQTWPSLAIGRGIAIVTALGLGKAIGETRSQKMMDWSEKLLTGSVAQNKNRWHRYAAITSLETTSCLATSMALESTSKLFAKRGVTVRNPEVCTAIVHDEIPPAGSAAPADDTDSRRIDPERFKKQSFVKHAKHESHADAAKASDTGFSLAT